MSLLAFAGGAIPAAGDPAAQSAVVVPPSTTVAVAPANAPMLASAPAAPAPAGPSSGDWRDWPVTPGTWVYRQDARGSIALFGRAGSDADVTIRCDRLARTIYFSRRGAAPGNAPMTIRTTSLTRTLATQPTGAEPAYMATALSPHDPLLDATGFSRGRFVIEQATLPVLVVPAWAEILRVTEDCRQ